MTSILQSLDTDFIFVYRHWYTCFANEWEIANLGTKLCAVSRCILGTHLTARAYARALEQVNIAESCLTWGYLWPTSDGSHIKLRELKSYQYNPHVAVPWFGRRPMVADEPQQKKKRKQQQPALAAFWSK